MKINPSQRATGLKYPIRNLARTAKEFEKKAGKVLYLNVGDPCRFDFQPPKHMIDAIERSMREGHNYYAFSSGIDEAREAIADNCNKKGLKDITPEKVIVTTGGSEGIEFALTALLSPGDNVLGPMPGYPLYKAVCHKLGNELKSYLLNEDDNWQPHVEDIEKNINEKTKGIVLINPNNPTGGVYSKKLLKSVIDIAAQQNIVIFADEVYDHLLLDDDTKHYPVGSLTTEVPVVSINSLSKNYLAPGWRTAWLSFSNIEKDDPYLKAINNLVDARLSGPTPQQFAIKPALEGPQDHIKESVKKFKERRDLTFKRLNEIEGLSLVKPKGAFYAFAQITTDKYDSDEKFVLDLLHKERVLVVHGSGFGQKPGTKHFRIAFLPGLDILSQAYDKIESFMKSI